MTKRLNDRGRCRQEEIDGPFFMYHLAAAFTERLSDRLVETNGREIELRHKAKGSPFPRSFEEINFN
jgi:hypothetical protein